MTEYFSNDISSNMQSQTTSRPYKIITIEGNIGSGKSTLLNNLKEEYKYNPNVVFLDEPVESWNNIKDSSGQTMLEKFYGNQEKYSFPFQMMAYISRLSVIKNAIQKHPGCVFISERCLYTDKHVFAKMLYDTGKIEDVNYQIYNEWFDTFVDEFVISHIIYVKTSPDICYSRVKSRSRDGEDSIPVEYLQDCHEYHTNMMKIMTSQRDTDILVLNGNVNLKTEPQQLKGWMEMIDRVVKKTCEDTDAVVVTEC